MIEQIDVWRAANLLRKQHGEDAAVVAAQRGDALLETGDLNGLRVWRRICRAITELSRQRHNGESVN